MEVFVKFIFFILVLSFSSHLHAKNLDAKKTINQYIELNMSLGYNDGSSLSLNPQETRGSYNLETFKLYKNGNDELTIERPAIQKELNTMVYFFERNIYNSKCVLSET